MERFLKSTILVALVLALSLSVGCKFYVAGIAPEVETLLCDDGLDNDQDGLTDCEDPDCFEACAAELCGNGTVDATGNEECDSGLNCGLDCKCPSDMDPDNQNGCLDPTLCGNDVLNPGEACDDGNTVDGDGCSANCLSDETCGNGVLDSDEICDEGGDTASCDADCSLPTCGDGYINEQANEECDSAGESASCNSDCSLNECGDGIVNTTSGEECDDAGESADCNVNCTHSECGDGVANSTDGEECDDAGESDVCNANCTTSVCGDSILNISDNEACDGGTDCINATCRCPEHLESDGNGGCTTSATACTDGVDGDDDGLTDCDDPDCYGPGCVEICDDGEDNDGDGDTDCDDTECGLVRFNLLDSNGGNGYVKSPPEPLWSQSDSSGPWYFDVSIDSADGYADVWLFTRDVEVYAIDGWDFHAWPNNAGYPAVSGPTGGLSTQLYQQNWTSASWSFYRVYCPGTMPSP